MTGSARAKLKCEYGELFDQVVHILARADPLALVAGGSPRDEYEVEARTTLPRHEPAEAPTMCGML